MQVSFDVDVQVNVFEANIRLLGGLLSAHLLAIDPKLGHRLMPGGYEGGLLDLAYSLALRLLPAFLESPTGPPPPPPLHTSPHTFLG
jgi:mannosidase alpha-like ER degradation enhancer 1